MGNVQLHNAYIVQIVESKFQFIAMDDCCKIYTLQLSPELGLQKITTEQERNLFRLLDRSKPHVDSQLVVCGDMLLMVNNASMLFSSKMYTLPP